MLTGKKTYLAAGGMVLTSVGGWLTGHLTPMDAITTALNGLALIFLRNGMANQQ